METADQVRKFEEFFDDNYKTNILEAARKGESFMVVDFKKLVKFDPELADLLLEDPEEVIAAAELAIKQFDIKKKFTIRFKGLSDSQKIMIRNIRSKDLNKFYCIEGIVRQKSDVRPQVTSAKFECPSCGNIINVLQLEQKFKEPSRCGCGRKGKFRLLSKDLIDAQGITLEEAPEDLEGGEQQKRMRVFLKDDLVSPISDKHTNPGSKILVNGIIKESPLTGKDGSKLTRFDLLIEANYVESVQEDYLDLAISNEDIKEIKKLAEDPNIYEKFANSMAPSIFGHEKIKEALILQLVGGVKKERTDGVVTRGDMHILLIGDPGSGKTALLKRFSKVAPKSRFVSGKGVSGAGLTASVVKDEFLGGWALEAGALPLCNRGFCCIDEMDKMSAEDTAAMHEALEGQSITISKANIQACYSSDTEVLTDRGWKKYLEVGDLKLAQYNPKNKTIEFQPHKGLYLYDYNGEMYHFKNKRNDILVTPNHRMLAREYSQKEYRSIEARDLKYDYIKFVNSGNFIGREKEYFILPPIKHKQNRKHPKYTHQESPKKIPMDIWLEFVGYYVSEGGIERRKGCPGIGIVQKNGLNAEKIKKCLSKMAKLVGFTLTEIDDSKYVRFKITNSQLTSYMDKNFGRICYERCVPFEFLLLSKRQLKILYKAMMLGDGSSDGKFYSSTSPEFIDIFQVIACLIGRSACKNVQYEKGKRGNRLTLYRVSMCDKILPSIRKKSIKKSEYNGKVFCFSTNTGFFITRRNGKIAIQGNTLRAETTVLAAANPKFGRFDPYDILAKQINMPPTLINRFDLIFPVKDLPDEKNDERLAKHILSLHQNPDMIKPEIDSHLLRRYIAYVRQRCKPVLTDAALNEIKKYYVEMRNSGSSEEAGMRAVPISARQLEGLVRLSEASAKIRLDDKVLKKDARRAIDLVHYCLMQVGLDPETGKIDIDRIATGVTTSQRSKIFFVKDIIIELENKIGKVIPIDDVLKECVNKGMNESEVEDVLEKLKRSGDIFEPKHGFVGRMP